jgi:hypothetical protein
MEMKALPVRSRYQLFPRCGINLLKKPDIPTDWEFRRRGRVQALRDVEVDGFVGWSRPPSDVDESSVAVVRALVIVAAPTKLTLCRGNSGESVRGGGEGTGDRRESSRSALSVSGVMPGVVVVEISALPGVLLLSLRPCLLDRCSCDN